jgi:uncharacterized membrane protein
MDWYALARILHLLALSVWLGHMFFWSIVVGPVTKRMAPTDAGRRLRELSLRWGALGWPALIVLAATGAFMLRARGATLDRVASGEIFAGAAGRLLGAKLALVAVMVAYQAFVGHRRAPRLVYLDMTAALLVVALSVLIVNAPGLVVIGWRSP